MSSSVPPMTKPVSDFSVIDFDGNPISLQEYRGKVTLLHFWEVQNDSCTAEMPNFKKVYDTYKDAGFDIIGVNLDSEEAILRSYTMLRNYIKINGIRWRQIFDTPAYSLLQQYDISGVPEMWLIDREGRLITHKARGKNLETLVAEAVKAQSQN